MFQISKTGLYIHIPYCRRKCLYCDFYSGGAKGADWALLTDALLNELSERLQELPTAPTTLYVGGGTPSLMPEKDFSRLIGHVASMATLNQETLEEFTIEVNPEDVNPGKAEAWKEAGVTRVSLGIQSLDDAELKSLGRRHTAAEATAAFETLQKYFSNISVDVMFGLPDQTMESWDKNLRKLLPLGPQHLSAYSLMYEERTALTRLRDEGRIKGVEEETSVGMFRKLLELTEKYGYRRYEISNFSFPGMESVHNSRYWTGEAYLGIGPSAHSYDSHRTRRFNPADLKGYLRRFSPGGEKESSSTPFYIEESLSDEELREEVLLTRMRTSDGLDLEYYSSRWGQQALARLLKNAGAYIKRGMLLKEGNRLRLSDEGVMIADEIIVDLSM